MKAEPKQIPISKLAKNYRNNDEEGVVGYNRRLDIRPIYQREFVYGVKERDAVIKSILANLPINVMYWAVRGDGTFEVIDGQQRTISICEYVHSNFSVNGKSFHNLANDIQQHIRDYEVTVYLCTGTASEKIDWFETINIAGKVHSKQEIRNAVYAGPWVTDAKKFFSKTDGPAYRIASDYVEGIPIRQHYFETAIKWISNANNDDDIRDYMDSKCHLSNADEIKSYFRTVIDWVEATFPTKRQEMKKVDWGILHREFSDKALDVDELEVKIASLMMDDDVKNKSGIYPYVLNGKEKHLNIRAFNPAQKRAAFERQGGICTSCGEAFTFEEMDGDHKLPWSQGGKTEPDNLQMLCVPCNRGG